MESSQKPVMNGIGSSPTSCGFRHQLPQIPVMARNPKIAQSKGSTKAGVVVNEHEHSTTDVEGVGKVVHIGSDVMDVDDSIDKMLDDMEKTNDGTDNKNSSDAKDADDSVPADKKQESSKGKKSEITKFSDEKQGESDAVQKKDSSNDKQNDAAGEIVADQSAETEVKPKAGNASKKPRKAKQQKAPEVDKNASMSDESPSKRQRKPKVFEDEPSVPLKTVKSPAEKSIKQKPVITPELEAKFPVKWFVGDLVWAKVASHPWWPCMVSYDPFTAVYTRINRTRDYHVQFFGDAAERAWISTNNLLDFLGKAKFDEYVDGLYKAAKSSKELKKLKKWYSVPSYKEKAVSLGVSQAEEALKMDKKERRTNYTFVYKLPKDKVSETVSAKLSELDEDLKIIHGSTKNKPESMEPKSSKKRKLDEVLTPKSDKNSAKKRKVETPTSNTVKTESPVKSGKKPSGNKTNAGSEGSFDIFCQKEREKVLLEHPEFTDDKLMDYCKQQWCMMSKQQKARYKSKHSEKSDLSKELSPNSGRKRKPSKKVIEAEEDNKVVEEVISGKKPSTPVATKSRKSTTSTPKEDKAEKVKKSRTSLPKAGQTPVADKETKVTSEQPKKRGRPSKGTVDEAAPTKSKSSDVDTNESSKPGVSSSDTDVEKQTKTTVIPAKRALPRKSLSTDSDKQSESGRSTRSPSPELIPAVKRPKEEYEYEMEIYKLSSTGPQKKENLCQICEQTGDLIECQGPCQGFFHTDCLGVSPSSIDSFKCDECSTGIHSCFACKKASADTQRCTVPVCGKFYHIDCVKKFSQAKVEGKGITCPLHSCHTCLAYNLKGSAARSNGRLLRCVRCPTAYHVGDFCIAAGSINLTGLNIVCARHFQPIPTLKHHSRVHVSWCFSCNKGGTLLCCEYCPAAYHAECLKIDFPTDSWYCPDCVSGKQPLYGEIIWVKLGIYRWWPAEICHPRNVPLNIQEKPHQVGEFPVHFLGSHEYFWLHQGRVFSYQDGDNGSGWSNSKKGLAKHFAKGLKEASEAYKSWKEFRENKEQMEIAKESKKPAPFKSVKTNIPLGSVVIKKADLSELPKCECKPDQEHPCGRESECLNGMMMYECHPALCPVGEKCENQFFTKRLYPPQQPYKTEGRGWGLKAMADIKKGQFVNEYVGDLIDEEECRRRLEKSHEEDIHNFYMMTLDMDRIIDAGPKGNLSRFMNHSCDPNLETQKWNVNGDVRVGLFALRDIKEGEELTFNYNFDCLGNEQTKCQCGSENCSGYLGVRPKSQHAAAMDEKKKKETKKGDKLKKKKKVAVKHKHDDDCFRCGEGGELVMCDRVSCTKSYHLRCLNLSKPPYGKWDCPWHHCDECGKPAPHKCVECPNSFCSAHYTDNIKEFDGKTYCSEHEDLLESLIESRTHSSNVSDDNSQASDIDVQEKASNGKKESEVKKGKIKDETLPPKKRGPKPLTESSGDKASNGATVKPGKGRKGSVKGDSGTKGAVSDDPLAVAPMFDDDEEEEFGLVIDIPNF
ncbi:Histone-lysine N-methyltransferase [Mactra antiquata]